jgi:tetratricopeptide (TPR) repeat protein
MIMRPITAIVHELGHGITTLLVTNGKATLYIGSYGDPNKSIVLKLGRLNIFFKYNPLRWNYGMCVPQSQSVSINRQLLISLFGPLSSILLGAVFLAIAFGTPIHDSTKVLAIFFAASALLDLWIDLVPRNNPIELFDGSIIYNDGHRLKELIAIKRDAKSYPIAYKLFENQDYKEAAEYCEKRIATHTQISEIYSIAIHAYIKLKDYQKAQIVMQKQAEVLNLNADDYSNAGLIESELKNYEAGLEYYQKSLALDPDHKYSLNNRGYSYNLKGEYKLAIDDFNHLLKVDPDFAYAYSNRGFSKIKLGLLEEGKEDLETALELDDQNSYAYMHFGVYNSEKGNYKSALKNFEKAFELDDSTHGILEHIERVKKNLK